MGEAQLREAASRRDWQPVSPLVGAIEKLAGARTAEDVIEILRTSARRLVGSDGISIVLRDEDKCHYVEEDAIGPLWKGQRFPMQTCISGWAMMHGKTAVIPDIFQDDRIPHAIYRERFVRALVMAPIGRNQPIAAIGAYWAKIHEPSDQEVGTLETLARAAATALENVHLIGALRASLKNTELARQELRHRLKNAFSAIGSLGDLVLPKEHAQAISVRLGALSRAYALLEHKPQAKPTILVGELIEAEIEPYRSDAQAKIALSGPPVEIEGEQAIALGLAVNELITNLAARGGLGSRGGLKVSWREENRVVSVNWEEIAGPTVQASVLQTFGSRLMRGLVEGQLKGALRRVAIENRASCTVEFPNLMAREFPANA
jgi:two-component sensor histidine kinase